MTHSDVGPSHVLGHIPLLLVSCSHAHIPPPSPTLVSGKVDHQPQCPRTLFRISRICGLIHTRSWRAPEGLLGPQAMSSPRFLPAQSPCLAPPVVAEPPRPLPVGGEFPSSFPSSSLHSSCDLPDSQAGLLICKEDFGDLQSLPLSPQSLAFKTIIWLRTAGSYSVKSEHQFSPFVLLILNPIPKTLDASG